MILKKFSVKVILICVVLTLAMNGCASRQHTDNMSNYLSTDVPLLFDEQRLFPDVDFLTDETVKQYLSESVSTFMFDDMFFLLRCVYSEAEYSEEVNRIVDSGAVFCEDVFQFPAYVMLISRNCYEYALINEPENEIIYVYAQTAGWEYFESFPDIYIPVFPTNYEICQYET